MRLISRHLTALLTTACVAATGLATVPAAHAKPDQLTIVSGSPGGSWYPIAAGIAEVFGQAGVRANAEVGAGLTNVIKVSRGAAELGVTTSTTPPLARRGVEPFDEEITNVRALATLFPSTGHIAVTEESGIESIAGLEGKRINTTAVGNSTQAAFVDVVNAYGLEESAIDTARGSQTHAANAVKDGNLDGLTLLSAYPNGTYTELFSSVPMRLLSIDDEHAAEILESNSGYSRATIPAGTYPGQEADVSTVRSDLLMIANADMSEEDAYWVVQTMLENIETIQGVHAIMRDITPEYMGTVSGIELHPGAVRAYREAGVDVE